MHQILQTLHEDHVNLMKLLTLVRRELHATTEESDADYNLISDALDYIQNYADAVHHVRENQIYARLREVHSEHTALVERMTQEHQQLQQATIAAIADLTSALNDVILDKHSLEESVENYLIAQQDHMSVEEREVFPLIDSVFTEDDWQQVAASVEADDDPLFGEQIKSRYLSLYESLKAATD